MTFRNLRPLGALLGSLILAACGGGGDSGGTTTPPAATYTVGGTVTGHTGTVVLSNAGATTPVAAGTGSFTVLSAAAAGATYAVTVATPPSGQTCTVANGSGTVASANVSNIAVTCTTQTFPVGGTVSGLGTGLSVVLQSTGYSDVTVNADGSYAFAAKATGTAYGVTVKTQPTGQTCTVANGTGTVASAAVTNINVTCTTAVVPTFTIGGTVSGLGTSLSVVLQSAGYSDVTVNASGSYAFAAKAPGTAYGVSVKTQPTGQTCTVANGTGTVPSAAVTNINVTCTNNTFSLSATVSGLVTGGTVVLQNNGANNLSITTNGTTAVATGLTAGTAYAITVFSSPATLPAGTPVGQTCTAGGSSTGTIAAANVTVAVTCVNNDTIVPAVTAKTPLPTTLGTTLTTTVTATFSEAMDTSSITASTFTVKGGNLVQPGAMTAVSGTLSFTAVSGATKVTFTPAAALSFDTDYTITATTGVKDGAGNGLASPVSWSFNTGKRITTGGAHACARFADGRVKCWGANDYGQLGINNNVFHGNGTGLMGNGTTGGSGDGLVPVIIPTALAGHVIVSMAAGDDHSCAIVDDGRVFCWGHDSFGELGLGFTATSVGSNGAGDMEAITPVNLGAGRTALQLSLGNEMSCARLDDGSVKCWGDGTHGALGQGSTALSSVALPVSLGTGRTAVEISAGGTRACAILDNNAIKCWGDNRWGQLGVGSANDLGDDPNEMGDSLPTVNIGTVTPLHLAVADGHMCVLTTAGAVRCWGNNYHGAVGNNQGNGVQGDIPTGGPCARVLDCFGDDPAEMGNATTEPIAAGGAVELTVGYRQVCTRNASAQIRCWGTNEFGQLGLGNSAGNFFNIGDQSGEMAVLTAAAMKQTPVELSGGGFWECVTNADGTAQCWGRNGSGQLGRGDTNDIGDGPGEMGSALTNVDVGT